MKRDRNLHRQARRIWLEQGRRCACCDKLAAPDRLELDHIVPVSKGGTDERSNLRVLDRDCHYERHRFDQTEPRLRESKKAWWKWLRRTERELHIRRIST